MKKTTFWLLCLPLLFACNSKPDSADIAATINGQPITLQEIDRDVRQELYDELSRIYEIRNIALKLQIQNRILEIEARKHGIIKDDLLTQLYNEKVRNGEYKRFFAINEYEKGVPIFERGKLMWLPSNTPRGQEIIASKFKDVITKELADSLRMVYKVDIALKAPKSPLIKMDDLILHTRGNVNSPVTFLEISDFDCSACRQNYKYFDTIYAKYKDRVKFEYSHFGSYVSLSARASESAAQQGKFWPMHDAIFALGRIPDTTEVYAMADKLKLNKVRFKKDMADEAIQKAVKTNIDKLVAYGLYSTPTIIINGRLVFNATSVKEMEELLDAELGE